MQLTVREAAKFLNVSEKTLYRWAGAGEIPVYRVNGQYRFNSAELLEWANARNHKVGTDVFREEVATGAAPTVAQALDVGGVHPLAASDKMAALRAMVDALPLPDRVDREMLYDILAVRESLGTTALGQGIAVPHVRSPMVLEVASAMISLFFLEKPIDFGAADGQPVHTLFWLITPTVKLHLHLISRLAGVIQDAGFRSLLLRRAPKEEILAEVRRLETPAGQGR